MEIGRHTVDILDKDIKQTDGGALMCNIQVKFDNGETGWAQQCMVSGTATGNKEMDKTIKTLRDLFGWNDDSLETLMGIDVSGMKADVVVIEDNYNGRIRPKIDRIYPIRQKSTAEDVKKLANQFKGIFKTSATASSFKKLDEKPAEKKVKKTSSADPVLDKSAEPEARHPSMVTWEKFCETFSNTPKEEINGIWNTFLSETMGELFDTDKASKEDWLKLYKAIPEYAKKFGSQTSDPPPFY